MAQHLEAGKPILGEVPRGEFSNPNNGLTRWMSGLPDSTPLTAINVPGTHDTCTWNYTGPDESVYRTQARSIFDQLNAGIRFLDIRFGLDSDSGVLRVYHADTLLSSTASLEDVLWGLYYFLENHPRETLLVSLKIDHGSTGLSVQQAAYPLITAPEVSDYWVQTDTLPTNLGSSRGKIVLFRRFSFDTTDDPSLIPVGVNVASGWTDNNADFSILYDPSQSLTSYIEDLYQLNGDAVDISPSEKVEEKFNAITTHISHSRGVGNTSQIFISFASGYGNGTGDVLTPRILAEGVYNSSYQIEGINAKINQWLSGQKGKRLGIVLYDFYESEKDLIQKTII
ncbi:hypothetical protein Clacol_010111 [Clathrus columnatus]|uniref:Phosphatidylinositol-specific phospholipase C X domain-containing protein n=1 Tax=Clathrus columnatus TaxID=1419009 RepID=A0AAV5AS45_9AGAM|nr:hypothetical protein Clacol_010111 [Clathrus columnatus]